MAFPTIPTAASGDLLSTATTVASTTHAMPNLSSLRGGAGPQAGDLLIACIAQYSCTSNNATFTTWGSTYPFTEPTNGDQGSTTGPTMALGVAYRVATGSESGTWNVTSTGTGFISAQFLMRIPAADWHGTTVPQVSTADFQAGAAANPASFDPPTGNAEDWLWIAFCGVGETSTSGAPPTLDTAPTNYSGQLVQARGTDAVGAVTAGVAFYQANESAEDAGTWTITRIVVGRSGALVIAVRPVFSQNANATPTSYAPTVTTDTPTATGTATITPASLTPTVSVEVAVASVDVTTEPSSALVTATTPEALAEGTSPAQDGDATTDSIMVVATIDQPVAEGTQNATATPSSDLVVVTVDQPTATGTTDGTATPSSIALITTVPVAPADDGPTVTGWTARFDAGVMASITLSDATHVSRWADLTDNHYDATQPTGSLQPVSGTRTSPTGRNVLDFTPTLTMDSPAPRDDRTSAFFLVCLADTMSDSTGVPLETQQVGGLGAQVPVSSGGNWDVVKTDTVGLARHNNGQMFTGSVYVLAASLTATDITTLLSSDRTEVDVKADTLTVGAQLRFNDPVEGLDGWMAEFIQYDRTLTVVEMRAVSDYLQARWSGAVSETAEPASIAATATTPQALAEGTEGGTNGDATPASIAVTATTLQSNATVDITATPTFVAVTATLNTATATGDGTASTTTIVVTATQDSPSAVGTTDATATPNAIVVAATVPSSGGSVVIAPAANVRTFTVLQPVASVAATPTSIAAAATVNGSSASSTVFPATRSVIATVDTAAATSTTTPAAIVLTATVNTSSGSASTSPAVILVSITIDQPSVQAGGNATANPVAVLITATTPTASASTTNDATATPTSFAPAITIPQSTGEVSASPASIAALATVLTPEISAGATTVPDALVITVTINPATASTGADADATPASITVTAFQDGAHPAVVVLPTALQPIVTVLAATATATGDGIAEPTSIVVTFTIPLPPPPINIGTVDVHIAPVLGSDVAVATALDAEAAVSVVLDADAEVTAPSDTAEVTVTI